MGFSQRLVALRQKKGLTQEELAQMVNMSRSALSLYELSRREPDFSTLGTLADFFEVSTDYLLGRTNESGLTEPSSPKKNEKDEEIELDFRIAANNEDGYGQEPSPELKRFVQEIIKEELDRVRKK
ncbi:helix-turn-helix domain-containing protein [Desulfosporosinus nitroreducens]|uniref:Helix-turn-helix domain-containing protein n=1 Tax=Desulfosporosinus nitroreducens TaxID=2018668 RepID=A0ABT8QTW9_9FIRM|nr:helix-turn-helix transcriptional regulator [Desulfosporosinus nitroreducens]MDO0824040.1 helix-turn-helix domain-containing protein [Desulfosporosinus nitroreducens]